jgi:putative chitinase
MSFDRDLYFESVRNLLFGGTLTQEQVDGQTVILAVWEYNRDAATTDLRHLAYMLATTFHETAQRMWPITEYGSDSYLQGKDYWPFIGRGFVQLTWEDNYRKASDQLNLIDQRDLVAHPELALDSLIATRVMFKGMEHGWFTGKSLSDYFNQTADDPYNARRIINGTDCADDIEVYHEKFLEALAVSETLEA